MQAPVVSDEAVYYTTGVMTVFRAQWKPLLSRIIVCFAKVT